MLSVLSLVVYGEFLQVSYSTVCRVVEKDEMTGPEKRLVRVGKFYFSRNAEPF